MGSRLRQKAARAQRFRKNAKKSDAWTELPGQVSVGRKKTDAKGGN